VRKLETRAQKKFAWHSRRVRFSGPVISVSPVERITGPLKRTLREESLRAHRAAGRREHVDLVFLRVEDHRADEQRDPKATTVGEVMTRDVICVEPETDLDEVSTIMQQKRIRHLPVCANGARLRGMISIGDLNAHHATNQEAHIHFLTDYVYGRV